MPQRKQQSAIDQLGKRLDKAAEPAIATPPSDMSFFDWLHTYAMVNVGSGKYARYSLAGRQPLLAVIVCIDYVLGNDCSYVPGEYREALLGSREYGEMIPDAEIDVCGGAQFGKTILGLLLKTYLGTVKFFGAMYCLPDDDLVQGIIDMKERPDVLDQIAYVGDMLQLGKGLTRTGRAANRKGATLYTDGTRNAVSMMRGLGKFPTSFSCDVVLVDERDDVREEYADFLPGRMTNSPLRLMINIGTQRYHGAGQNELFDAGTKHVGTVTCPDCGREHCLEEDWPGISRMSVTGVKSPRDPRLDDSGRFVIGDQVVAKYSPKYTYYPACVECGHALDREQIAYAARNPDMIANHRWSIRVSQLSCSALDWHMFVSDWCTKAVKDQRKRAAFFCDRIAIPRASAQKLSPGILDRAERVDPYNVHLQPRAEEAQHRFAGLDTGDQCWLVCRDVEGKRRRLAWTESMADSDTRARAIALYTTLGIDCLFVDAGPLRDLSRDLALGLNGLDSVDVRQLDWEHTRIDFGNGVSWDGERGEWSGLRCAPIEFSAKPGSGIKQQARLTPNNRNIYPVISTNRDEAIQAVIDELLVAEDGLAVVDPDTGGLRTEPVYLLPVRRQDDGGAILETYRKHLLTGSCKVKDADGKEEHFVDNVPNHLLLATVYARLAEEFAGIGRVSRPPSKPKAFTNTRAARIMRWRRSRGVLA